jgi:hypothetical protein
MTRHEHADRPAAERLEDLGDEIDDLRDRLADDQGEQGPRFVQQGRLDDKQPVDDTITPPG